MTNLRRRNASEVGILPTTLRGFEGHGRIYLTWPESDTVGAQCSTCHTIVWVNPRTNSVLSEKKPPNVPDSGVEYSAYYHENLRRFFGSLPACPNCGHKSYDKFVNNVSLPRFADGTDLPRDIGARPTIEEDPKKVSVWWYE
jgi:hypothetical protein